MVILLISVSLCAVVCGHCDVQVRILRDTNTLALKTCSFLCNFGTDRCKDVGAKAPNFTTVQPLDNCGNKRVIVICENTVGAKADSCSILHGFQKSKYPQSMASTRLSYSIASFIQCIG
jgi:hypothetical protein